jgi:dienelactone hydrolase
VNSIPILAHPASLPAPAGAFVREGLALLGCAACGLSACPGSGDLDPSDDATPALAEEVELLTQDGLAIAGTWHAADGADRGPGALLLHDVAPPEVHDRHDFDSIFEDLRASGVSVLALDFRSHGASEEANVPEVDLGSDRGQLRWDVQAGIEYLQDRNAEVLDEHIGVLGLGLGASMAVVADHESRGQPGDWGSRATVAVSASLDRAQDLNPLGDLSLELEAARYVAPAGLPGELADAQELLEMSAEPRDLVSVAGTAAHGRELLEESGLARERVVGWIGELWGGGER